MKKYIILFVGLIVLGGLGWYVYDLTKHSGSSIETELIEFGLKNTDNVDKIIISNDLGEHFEIIKTKHNWTAADGSCIGQPNVEYILDVFRNIEFKGYLTENSVKTHKKIMMTKHIKVEIFENGEWSKSWYLGPPSSDHYGQIMLLDSKEYGMSDKPVIMHVKGLKGIIEPTFYADPKKWECTNIFALAGSKIKKVDVKFIKEPTRSFSIESEGTNFTVKQNNKIMPQVDTSKVFMYLNKYKKIHFNIANYIFNDKQVDSLKKTTPFCVLTVEEKIGKKTKLKMYHIPTQDQGMNEFGVLVNYDTDNFWCLLPSGELVKCQFFVFNPLILGHMYFPLDMSEVKTEGYEVSSPDAYKK